MSPDRLSRPLREHRALLVIVLFALAHGLTYVFLVPPWQHYDEPDHFEYAWLAANRSAWPEPGDYDATMRLEVASSMVEHGFFQNLGYVPDLSEKDQPIALGFTQLEDPPFYYLLTSLPLRVLGELDITLQLYSARLISLLLFVTSILAAYGVASELTPAKHPLRIMMPAVMAMLPGFVDLMTSVNNDAGATALFSLFLWGAVRMIRRGLSPSSLLWTACAAVLCFFTKNTAMLAVLLLPIAVLFSLFRGNRRWIAWSLLAASALGGLIAVFSWGDAAYWYRDTEQASPTRLSILEAPLGENVIRIDIPPNASRPALQQAIPPDEWNGLNEERVTLGAWIWASEPIRVSSPILLLDGRETSQELEVGIRPKFFAFASEAPEGINLLRVDLAPLNQPMQRSVTVFYDGLVLASGDRPLEQAPSFSDPQGGRGEWGQRPFKNLIRNGSGERGWPRIRPWAVSLIKRVVGGTFYGPPSQVLASLLDWEASSVYYRSAAANLMRTFWAKFGWGHVPLLGSKPYRLLAGVTTMGMAGLGLALWRRRRTLPSLPWASLTVLGLALLGIWGMGLVRGAGSFWTSWAFIPSARYIYPAIIPTTLVLSLGWLEIERRIWRGPRSQAGMLPVLTFVFFLALDVFALVSLVSYYEIR